MFKRYLHRVVLIWVCCFLPVPLLYAQPYVDIVSMRYQSYSPVEYSSKDAKMGIAQSTYSLTLPIEFKNNDALILGGCYEHLSISSKSPSESRKLDNLNLQLGYLYNIKDTKTKLLLVGLPKLISSRIDFSQNTFQMGGVFLLTRQFKKNFALKAGLYYNREYFGNFFIPLIGLEWRPYKRLHLFGTLPASLNLEYKALKKLYIGATYYNLTQSYRINNTSTYVRNGDPTWGNIQVKGYVNVYLFKYMVFFAEAGYTFQRRYELYGRENKLLANDFFLRTQNGPMFALGVNLRIRLDD